MTVDAPDRYTVAAVFTRRPEDDEIREILGDDTRHFLTGAGYPTVEVTVTDRRLEIANTNLEELRDGLARVLAERLAEISTEVHSRQRAAAARFQHAAESERDRAASVVALAESVRFATGSDAERASASAQRDSFAADRTQIDDWADEGGGHGR
ncbi:MAG: hypothetical protein ACNYNX_06170 [Leucobacter sp.]